MPHHATALNDILDRPVPTAPSNPCAKNADAQHGENHPRSLSVSAFERITAWMAEQIETDMTEDTLCAQTSLSPHALRRAFDTHAGMAPILYLTWMRVDMAVRLLIDTQFDLDQIAYVTGLKNAEHLTRACLQTLRVRPQALRVSVAL